MKKSILLITVMICSVMYAIGQERLDIDISKSSLKWSCDYSFYFGGHYGFIKLKEGYFIKTEDKITGGSFIINMHAITNTDIDVKESNVSLVEHLEGEDFFNTKQYPTAKLDIVSTNYHDSEHLEVTAELTIKGITRPIKFQVEADYKKTQMKTKFKIDRTNWNINYKSKSLMGDLKNEAISDAIGFEIILSL